MLRYHSTRTPDSSAATRDVGARVALLHRRRGLIRALALIGVILMLLVIALSAYMRLSQSGLGCAEWPGCQGRILREAAQAVAGPDAPGVTLARRAHRVAASTVLLLTLILTLVALAVRPRLWHVGRLALAMLLLTLGLAVLGVVAGGAKLPAVVLGNLLGGFAMVALSWRLLARAGGGLVPAAALRRWARLGLLLLVLQVVLGGLVSATYGASACSAWGECADAALRAGWDWRFLDPWSAAGLDGIVPLQPRGAWLQWLHHLGVLLLLPVLTMVAWLALRQGQAGWVLILGGLLVVQWLLGMLLVPFGFALPLVLAHNLGAALLLTLLARWA